MKTHHIQQAKGPTLFFPLRTKRPIAHNGETHCMTLTDQSGHRLKQQGKGFGRDQSSNEKNTQGNVFTRDIRPVSGAKAFQVDPVLNH